MPFSALVQRQFSLRATLQACEPTASIPGLSVKKRRISTNTQVPWCKENITWNNVGENRVRDCPPAWVDHLRSFRYRPFCSSAAPRPTRSITPSTVLNNFLPTATTSNGSIIQTRQCRTSVQYINDIEDLVQGNQIFRKETLNNHPRFFEESAKGQKPPYMLIDCSDSRVAEQAIFDARPGTMFTSGSIANQFHEWDLNSNSVLSYAVETLGVRHVIVMGHYGCGGVAASMLPVSLPLEHPAHIAVQTWIQPIREIYQTSTRPDIVVHRDKYKSVPLTELPDLHDPAFRALVEENVKANVNRISGSYVMRDHYASLSLPHPTTSPSPPVQDVQQQNEDNNVDPSSTPPSSPSLQPTHVFIHGWVYDLENGEVTDLNVTVGPPGREIPKSSWPSTEIREREKRQEWQAKLK